ncbi:MAG: aminoacyl-tRNA hydrolase [Phycisphaeraceae bacterium]|nr:aminoacyl-tRNA hydrolase [Phycisphaeraceae bacterium]
MDQPTLRLIVGLGNPGPQYVRTRHNAGFMVIDRLVERFSLQTPDRARFNSLTGDGAIEGHRVLLLKPMTFMNRSGQSVIEALNFYKLDPQSQMLVVVDDLALETGRIRLRASGSAGGHNGLTDIQRALGHANYPRLRVGIDDHGMIPQVDYVLGKFTPDQAPRVQQSLDDACNAIACWLTDGIQKAMTRHNPV